jgi:hypothetical protein
MVLAGLFVLGMRTGDLRGIFWGLTAGLGLNLAFVIAQLANPSFMLQAAPPAGLLVNKNLLAEFAALGLVAAIAVRFWPLILTSAPILVLTSCRGAILALWVALACGIWPKARWAAVAMLVLPAGLGLWGLTSGAIPENDHSSTWQRLRVYQDTLASSALLGHGTASFYHYFPRINTLGDAWTSRPEHTHNEFLEIGFEQGVLGFLLLAPVAFAARAKHPLRLVLVAGAVIALVAFPFRIPTTGAALAFLAGWLYVRAPALGHRVHGRRGALDVGISPSHARAGVGTPSPGAGGVPTGADHPPCGPQALRHAPGGAGW